MSALVGIVFLLVSLVTLAGSIVVLPLLWRACVDQWRRTPAERRPRALAAAGATTVGIAVAATLAILAPWGSKSAVYVLLFGFGGMMLLVLVGVAVAAVQESRQATRRLRAGASAENHPSASVHRSSDSRGE